MLDTCSISIVEYNHYYWHMFCRIDGNIQVLKLCYPWNVYRDRCSMEQKKNYLRCSTKLQLLVLMVMWNNEERKQQATSKCLAAVVHDHKYLGLTLQMNKIVLKLNFLF